MILPRLDYVPMIRAGRSSEYVLPLFIDRYLTRLQYGLQGDRNGQDGQDARAALNGGPAGSLAVELTESADQVGYIHAHTIRWEGPRQPVLSTEIPPRHRLLLSAAGGRGEAGGIGGDGTNGLQGANGRDATERDDAGVSEPSSARA